MIALAVLSPIYVVYFLLGLEASGSRLSPACRCS